MKQKLFSLMMEPSKTHIYKGAVSGLEQSSVFYSANLQSNFPIEGKKLFVFLNQFEEFDEIEKNDFYTAEEVVRFILLLNYRIVQNCKIPLFEEGKIVSIRQISLSEYQIDFLICYEILYPSQLTLIFIFEMLHDVFNHLNKYDILREKYLQLKKTLQKFSHQGINQMRFFQAAKNLHIPFRKYLENIYIFGNGVHSRLLESTLTDKSSKIATHIAQNKYLTNQLLKSFGLPVPRQIIVFSLQQAIDAAQEIGYPVVLKPIDLEGGTGVFAGIRDNQTLQEVFSESIQFSKNLAIEKHIFGQDYRLTVFQNEVIKTILRLPGGVYGDGIHNINELIIEASNHPQIKRRSKEKGYAILTLDSEAKSLLKEKNLDESYIPKENEFIPLRRKSNAYTGGLTKLIEPKLIHPDNINLAIRCAKALKIDILGVDLLISDISISYLDTLCGICEVNSQPQIGNSDTPFIYEDILKKLIRDNGLIPIVLIYSEKEFFFDFSFSNKKIGLYQNNSIFIGNVMVNKEISFYDGCIALLNSFDVEAVVCYVKNNDFKDGLPCTKVDFLLVLDECKELEMISENCMTTIFDIDDFKQKMEEVFDL